MLTVRGGVTPTPRSALRCGAVLRQTITVNADCVQLGGATAQAGLPLAVVPCVPPVYVSMATRLLRARCG